METSNDAEDKLFRVNNNLCGFSPCGEYFAIAYQANLIIKKTKLFETQRLYVFADIIEYIEWAPDGQYILCASLKKAIVQVYSINYPDWRWKLAEGSAGMERVNWAHDSAHIVTTADFNILISIWSLETRNVTHIQNLKSSANKNLAFDPNGKYLAVVVTDCGIDGAEIYRTDGWKISRKLLCEKLSAIDGLTWSPNGELLCIWCSISGRTKLLVYSTISESHVGAYSPEVSDSDGRTNDSQTVQSHRGPRGIDKIVWNPNGQLLAIAAHNETIVLLNYVTWKPILELRCQPVVKEADYLSKVYRECFNDDGDAKSNSTRATKPTMEEVNERPINIPIASNSTGLGVSIAAIDIFEFSGCGRYLAMRHQVYCCTIWIWDIAEDTVDHLLFKRPVSGISWSPNSPRLFVFTESPYVFEWWSGRRVACYPSPTGITVLTGQWHPNGKTLALCGYNKTAIMHVDNRRKKKSTVNCNKLATSARDMNFPKVLFSAIDDLFDEIRERLIAEF